jgi:hypothetical protein
MMLTSGDNLVQEFAFNPHLGRLDWQNQEIVCLANVVNDRMSFPYCIPMPQA